MNDLFPWGLPTTLSRIPLFLLVTTVTLALYAFGITAGVLLAFRALS